MRNFSGQFLVAALLTALTACGASSTSTAPTPTTSATPTSSATPAASATPATSATSAGLESYTDQGDGCQQAISAIAYADDVLRPLGQEPYQEFTDLVRSRVGAVAGTLSLEAEDWPSPAVQGQAQVVHDLAETTTASLTDQSAATKAARTTDLLRYRIEAGKLVLACREAGVK